MMQLYLYTLSDLSVIESMVLSDLADCKVSGNISGVEEMENKLLKIWQEKRRRLSNTEFITANDEDNRV